MAYLPLTHSKPDSSRSHTLPTPAITYSSTRSSSPPPKRVKPSNPIHQDFSNHPTTSLYGSRSSSGITRSYTPTGQSKIAPTVSRSSSHLVRELDFRQNTREHQSPIDVQAHSILESYKARPETVSELMNILNVDGRRVPTLQILLETAIDRIRHREFIISSCRDCRRHMNIPHNSPTHHPAEQEERYYSANSASSSRNSRSPPQFLHQSRHHPYHSSQRQENPSNVRAPSPRSTSSVENKTQQSVPTSSFQATSFLNLTQEPDWMHKDRIKNLKHTKGSGRGKGGPS